MKKVILKLIIIITIIPFNTYAKTDDPAERIFVGAISAIFMMIILWVIGKSNKKKDSK